MELRLPTLSWSMAKCVSVFVDIQFKNNFSNIIFCMNMCLSKISTKVI